MLTSAHTFACVSSWFRRGNQGAAWHGDPQRSQAFIHPSIISFVRLKMKCLRHLFPSCVDKREKHIPVATAALHCNSSSHHEQRLTLNTAAHHPPEFTCSNLPGSNHCYGRGVLICKWNTEHHLFGLVIYWLAYCVRRRLLIVLPPCALFYFKVVFVRHPFFNSFIWPYHFIFDLCLLRCCIPYIPKIIMCSFCTSLRWSAQCQWYLPNFPILATFLLFFILV